MGNALVTASTASTGIGSIMTVLADDFLEAKRNKGRILKFCNTDGEQIKAAHGTARFMLAPSNTTVNDEVDGTTPNLDDTLVSGNPLNAGYVDISLNVHKTVVFGFTQIEQALDGGRSIPPVIQGRMYSLFNVIEQDICALASTATTNVLGTPATALSESTYDSARADLVEAQVPDHVPLTAFYSPGPYSFVALSNLAGFRQWAYTGRTSPDVETTYGDGTYWKGARHFESQNVKRTGANTDSVDTVYNFLFSKDAILVAMLDLPIPTSPGVEAMNFRDPDSGIAFQILKYYDQAHGGDVMKIHSLYGKGFGREDWIALLLS